nr:S8 family serine peptidase [Bacteroidota bacterium]
MKKLSTLLLMAVILILGLAPVLRGANLIVITESLKQKLEVTPPDDQLRINITLRDQFDSQTLISQAQKLTPAERRAFVISVLKDFSKLSQDGVLADLNRFQRSDDVSDITTFWIANVITCFATPEVINALAARPDIAEIDFDEYRVILDPRENANAWTEEGTPDSREITWNVLKINADDVWALGLTGDGIIVSVIDTGVNYNHVDLNDHVWENPDYPYHGYDFVNNDNNPMDDHGHGTHCSGTVAGDGTAGSQTGVAPDATIMCCKVLDAGGGGSESGVWEALEFSIEQGAHIVSLSLGWQHSWGVNRTVWRQTFDNILAAGVAASVAAGNEGDQQGTYPIPDNVRTPGDIPPPWLHPDQTLTGGISGVICVGATDNGDNVSGYSSRGPLDWSAINPFNDYPYQPEMGLIRPDIVAPGTGIKSLDYSSNNGYASGWSGTSMATPANAGMLALMLQKNNVLTPEQISQIIEGTAVVLTPGKNNTSGSGRIDALAAVNATSLPGPSYYAHEINDEAGNGDGFVDPAESVLLTLSMGNFSDEPANNVTVEITTDNVFITITDGMEYFGDFGLEDIIEMEDAFAFDAANNIPGDEEIEFIINAYNDDEAWESSFIVSAHGVTLMVGSFTISDISGNNNGSLDPGETADIMIETMNMGQIDAPEAMAELTTTSSDITINSSTFDLETLGSGETIVAIFNITVDAAAPIGTAVDLMYGVTSGYYMLQAEFFPKIGLIVEDFETGDFSQFDWEFSGNQPWTVVASGAYEGTYCAKSGAIGNDQSTEIKITIDVANSDSIAFFRKASTEADYDFLEFYIDNSKKDEWAGEVGWSRVAYAVTAGTHTFRWRYVKDSYVTGGSDCAWVDFIELPAMVDETMMVNAGNDAELCEGMEFETEANAQNFNTLMWGTSGTGSFDDNTVIDAMYYPSEEDYGYGMVMLSLTAYGEGGTSVTDELELGFLPLPEQVGNIIGETDVCMGSSTIYSVYAAPHADSYNWVLSPVEAGDISGNDTLVILEWADEWTGNASLMVQGMNDCGNGDFSEALQIQVDDCTGIDEKLSSETVSIYPNPASGNFSVSFKNIAEVPNRLKIVDIIGNVLIETDLNGQHSIDLDSSKLEDGIYFVIIETDFSQVIEKLIIHK